MNHILYAFEIVPGKNDLLQFAETLEDARTGALEQRAEIRLDEPDFGNLAPMAIYRVEVQLPDIGTLVKVMNDEIDLCEACVVDRRLVGFVVD